MKILRVVLAFIIALAYSHASGVNLIVNGGAEEALGGGTIQGWQAVSGNWTTRSADPSPAEGKNYFFAGAGASAKLSQTIDVTRYASAIDAGKQQFNFSGFVRSYQQSPADIARIVITLLGVSGPLRTFDSGDIVNVSAWQPVIANIAAPAGTRSIRIELTSIRRNGTNNDGYFDGLSLTPVPGATVVNEYDLDATNVVACKSAKSGGCTTWDVSPLAVSLTLSDMPISYKPPFGPRIEFNVHYSHRDVQQPATFSYWNLGRQWTTNWLSYITDNVLSEGGAKLYQRGGGAESYTFSSASRLASDASPYTSSILVRKTDASGQTIGFSRTLSDGSAEEFNRAAGSIFFMTATIDRAGNRVALNYDVTGRLVSIIDAIGQQTILSYRESDPLKLSQVTDPFGRSARFAYNNSGQLASITDSIGIVSEFTYGPGNFVNALKTPYGITRFAFGDSTTDPNLGTTRYLVVTDALNRTSRYEFNDNAPGIAPSEADVPTGMVLANSELNRRNTFIWNPVQYAAATANGGLDYTKARIIHWLRSAPGASGASRVIASSKEPLEARVWYRYDGQPDPSTVGSSNQPTQIGRALGFGQTQLYAYRYNVQGNVVESIDPKERRLTFEYAPNGIDLTAVINASAGNAVIASYNYNAQHLPLTIRGANGLATTIEYNAAGQPTLVADPANNRTSYIYNSNGYLTDIQGPIASARFKFDYDSAGRLSSATDPSGRQVGYTYDDADRPKVVTFPDTTTIVYGYDLLDLTSIADRLKRTTRLSYDAERQLIDTVDAQNRRISRGYSGAGTLNLLTDANRNSTRWDLDLQDRAIQKVYANGLKQTYQYEPNIDRLRRETDALGQGRYFSYNYDNSLSSLSYENANVPTTRVQYLYDSAYLRPTQMSDARGTTTYEYHPVGSLGGNMLRTVRSPSPGTNGGDVVSYSYDALNRVVARDVNGVTDRAEFDALGRISTITNALDRFTYSYSDGTSRPSAFAAGRGHRTDLTYFDPTGDGLLQRITHTNASGAMLAEFGYGYDANHNVKTFTEAYLNQRFAAAQAVSGVHGDPGIGGLIKVAVSGSATEKVGDRGFSPRLFGFVAWALITASSIAAAWGWWVSSRSRRRWLWPVAPIAISVALASCGGGDDAALSNQPENATLEQRMLLGRPGMASPSIRPLSTGNPYGAVDAASAVEQLFDVVAEPSFPQLFPGHKTTQRFGVYRYRFYPETGMYVAVAVGVTPGDGLVESGVYVLGGAFGTSPRYVGLLLDFITPVAGPAVSTRVTRYDYDLADRLVAGTVGTNVSPPSGAPKHAFAYDPASNLTSLTVNGNPRAQSYTNTNALSSLAYDANGSPTGQDGWSFSWDAANRLVRAKNDSSLIDFMYDGNHHLIRIIERQGNFVVSDKSYLWCGEDRCQERDNLRSGAPITKRYFQQGVVVDGAPYYYNTDQLGSIRQLTNAAGVIQSRYDYDPYGARTRTYGGAVEPDLGFTGFFRHAPTGLDFAVYRGYDSQRGRWLNRDPIEEDGGENLYKYASGNPTTFSDPLGLRTEVIVWSGVGMGNSAFGHVSQNINGRNYSWGPNGWDTRYPSSVDYNARQRSFRGGIGYELNLSPREEVALEKCLQSHGGDYGSRSNNCTTPIQTCLPARLQLPESRIFPGSLGVDLGRSPGLVRINRYPNPKPIPVAPLQLAP